MEQRTWVIANNEESRHSKSRLGKYWIWGLWERRTRQGLFASLYVLSSQKVQLPLGKALFASAPCPRPHVTSRKSRTTGEMLMESLRCALMRRDLGFKCCICFQLTIFCLTTECWTDPWLLAEKAAKTMPKTPQSVGRSDENTNCLGGCPANEAYWAKSEDMHIGLEDSVSPGLSPLTPNYITRVPLLESGKSSLKWDACFFKIIASYCGTPACSLEPFFLKYSNS
jgi:hypothetical protein